jgi:hypothetical protein
MHENFSFPFPKGTPKGVPKGVFTTRALQNTVSEDT